MKKLGTHLKTGDTFQDGLGRDVLVIDRTNFASHYHKTCRLHLERITDGETKHWSVDI